MFSWAPARVLRTGAAQVEVESRFRIGIVPRARRQPVALARQPAALARTEERQCLQASPGPGPRHSICARATFESSGALEM